MTKFPSQRRLAALALLLLVGPPVSALPAPREEAARWAVVIGVGTYPALGGEDPALPGAAPDARAVREALVDRAGYPPDQVRLLLDGAATRDVVEEALVAWLGARVAPGDHVLVYFAGLGSRVPDLDGDEADGFDETLLPADALPASAGRDITDDVLGAWMDGLPSTEVVVVLDAGGTPAGEHLKVPGSRGRTLRRASDPAGEARRPDVEEDGFEAGGALVLAIHAGAPGREVVERLFPAPGADPFPGGVFTTHLLRALWRLGPGAPHGEVVREISRTLRRDGFRQAPTVAPAGVPASRPLVAAAPEGRGEVGPLLTVRAADGEWAEVAAGARLGLLPGSVLATPGGEHLLLETVRADASRGRRIGSEATAGRTGRGVTAGEAVRLVGHPFRFAPLRIGVAEVGDTLALRLAETLGDGARVALVREEAGPTDLHLLRDADGTVRVVGGDGYPRREGLPEEEVGRLVDLIRGEAARALLAGLDHPAPPFPVELRLEGNKERFATGETIAFHVTPGEAGFLTLVDVGTDGMVSVLLPTPDAPSVPVEGGQTLTFPGEEMGFALGALPPSGHEMVAAFVTPRPLELPLDEGYLEGDERLVEILATTLADAVGSVEGAVRLEGWSSAIRTYEIRD